MDIVVNAVSFVVLPLVQMVSTTVWPIVMSSTTIMRLGHQQTYRRKLSGDWPRQCRLKAGAAAVDPPAPPVVEMKDVMDASLGAIDRTVYEFLKAHAPVAWNLSSFSVRCSDQAARELTIRAHRGYRSADHASTPIYALRKTHARLTDSWLLSTWVSEAMIQCVDVPYPRWRTCSASSCSPLTHFG